MKEEVPMKKRLVVMAILFALTMVVATQVAQAERPMLVNVPFEFIAGKVTLPAGEYRIQKVDAASVVLLISSSDTRAAVMLTTNAAQAKKIQTESSLVFNKYGHRYFLSQVWTEGSIRGRQLLKSQREKEAAQVASLETKGEITLVAGLFPARP
jgi:hypothetical protein